MCYHPPIFNSPLSKYFTIHLFWTVSLIGKYILNDKAIQTWNIFSKSPTAACMDQSIPYVIKFLALLILWRLNWIHPFEMMVWQGKTKRAREVSIKHPHSLEERSNQVKTLVGVDKGSLVVQCIQCLHLLNVGSYCTCRFKIKYIFKIWLTEFNQNDCLAFTEKISTSL